MYSTEYGITVSLPAAQQFSSRLVPLLGLTLLTLTGLVSNHNGRIAPSQSSFHTLLHEANTSAFQERRLFAVITAYTILLNYKSVAPFLALASPST
jgi:hypothetical protein